MGFRKGTILVVNHKLFEFFIICLTVIYCCIVFVALFFQDNNIRGWFTDEEYNLVMYINQVIEMVILIIFIAEIFIKIYAFGFAVKKCKKPF